MERKSSVLMLGVIALALLLNFSSGGYALAQGSDSILNKIETATTRADHEAIAAYYEQEAKTAQASSDDHRQRAEKYKKGTGYGATGDMLVGHCVFIADKYKQAAGESLTMAKMHRDLAASAGK